MKKILAFSGSSNLNSINQKLAIHVSGLIPDAPITIIHLRDFSMPIYDQSDEQSNGIPQNALKLKSLIEQHDAFIIAVSENNQSVSAVFKNAMDWISRGCIDYKIFRGKPVLLLGTAPGPRGAIRAVEHAEHILSGIGATIIDRFSLPQFYENVKISDTDIRIVNKELLHRLQKAVAHFNS